MGHPVVVLEANEQPGGRASVWHRDGYTFDAGPTVITAPYLLDELFAALGRNPRDYYTLESVDPFYRVLFPDGSRFDYVGDDERLLSQIQAMSPRDVDGYQRLVKQAQAIFDTGYTQLADQPFHRFSDMLRVVPDMIRLGSYRSVYGMVQSYIRDERLRQVLTFEPLLIGGNPFTAPSIYLLIHWLERKWGVWFPRGGTGAVVSALVRMLDEVGVEVRCNSAVTRILVQGGKTVGVELADGTRVDGQAVVYNGDPTFAYSKLMSPAERPSWSNAALARVKPSMSLFVSYFGTKDTLRPVGGPAPTSIKPDTSKSVWPDLAHHTIIMGPRYRELLDDIFEKKTLADDMSLYIHAPTRTDPALAPPGDDAFYVLSPVPNQRSGIKWEDHQARYQDAVMAELERRLLPGLRDRVTTQMSVDPRYFEGRLRTVDGAAFGPEPILTQSAWLRYHNRADDVGGLYFVGAGTHPGAGVPGVLCSAKVLERVVPAPAERIAVPPVLSGAWPSGLRTVEGEQASSRSVA